MSPTIIAEMSANHNGSLDRAFGIILAAKNAGADYIKFQTFNPDDMAVPNYRLPRGEWKGRNLRELYQEAQTPYLWHYELFRFARETGIKPMSSPFSVDDVDFLEGEGLHSEAYKIASYEIVDLELIKKVMQTGKPVFISTGAASQDQIGDAVDVVDKYGDSESQVTFMHCVSDYPTDIKDANLKTMDYLRSLTGWDVGLSDHSNGVIVPITAAALGATAIEKHLTIDKTGLDAKFSLTPREFSIMVKGCHDACDAIGGVKYGGGDKSLQRTLYYAADLPRGTIITRNHVKALRPALGAMPKHLDKILGTVLREDVKQYDPISIE